MSCFGEVGNVGDSVLGEAADLLGAIGEQLGYTAFLVGPVRLDPRRSSGRAPDGKGAVHGLDAGGDSGQSASSFELRAAVPVVFDQDDEPAFVQSHLAGDVAGRGTLVGVGNGLGDDVARGGFADGTGSLGGVKAQAHRDRAATREGGQGGVDSPPVEHGGTDAAHGTAKVLDGDLRFVVRSAHQGARDGTSPRSSSARARGDPPARRARRHDRVGGRLRARLRRVVAVAPRVPHVTTGA